jgi:hypothetical protein
MLFVQGLVGYQVVELGFDTGSPFHDCLYLAVSWERQVIQLYKKANFFFLGHIIYFLEHIIRICCSYSFV